MAADLEAANFDAPRPPDVMPWKYRKLISNIGNVFQALVARNGDWRPLAARAEAEARAVLDAAGIGYTNDEDEREARAAGFTMKPVPGVDDPGGSTWQSLARGTGNVETDYLNGEIVAIAHRIGLTAPLNADPGPARAASGTGGCTAGGHQRGGARRADAADLKNGLQCTAGRGSALGWRLYRPLEYENRER